MYCTCMHTDFTHKLKVYSQYSSSSVLLIVNIIGASKLFAVRRAGIVLPRRHQRLNDNHIVTHFLSIRVV